MANYTYKNGIGAKVGETPMPNCFNRNIIELADGRAFYDKTGTCIGRDYVESKDCYEIVKSKAGNEYAVNLCNGYCYSMLTQNRSDMAANETYHVFVNCGEGYFPVYEWNFNSYEELKSAVGKIKRAYNKERRENGLDRIRIMCDELDSEDMQNLFFS